MQATSHSREPPLRGPEEWKVEAGKSFSQWDRWFLVVLITDHDGSWASLETALERQPLRHGFQQEDAEAKLCHLGDLRDRVERAGLSPAELLAEDLQDRRVLRKARTKLFDQYVRDRVKTKAMRETPRKVLGERAQRGNWAGFPVSPSRFERTFLHEVEERPGHSPNATFGLSRRLEKSLRRLVKDTRGDPAALLALHRAFLTAMLEAFDRANDSCGVLAQLFQEQLSEYFKLPWRDAGLSPETYYGDFLEFAIWEHYGLTWRQLHGFFKAVDDEDIRRVETLLRSIRGELAGARLEYQADEALTLLGELHVAKRSYDRFVELARQMGSHGWERITKMAELAWRAGRCDLAAQVFAAADQPGPHRDYLRRRCLELTGRTPPG